MPKHIIDFLPVNFRLSDFKPDIANLRQSISRKLVLSLALTALAVCSGTATAADIDMDGIQDGVDIDDDNDGILDSVEGTLVPPTGPVASTLGFTYTPQYFAGNISDTALYPNAGTFNGVSFDLKLTVVANSDPANLIVDISGYTQVGITYPVALLGTANTGTASIDFEFLISGTTTPMQVPSVYTWVDLDNNEKVTVASNELSEYQLGNPTNISVSTVGGNTEFSSSVSGGPADESRWIRTTLLSNSKFTFQYDKRTGDTGYIWDVSTYTSGGATPVVLNPEAFYAGDIDGDGISNSNDLDSDNDGISDLVESGTTQSNIMNDADSSGSVSLAEANSAMGPGLGDADGDGLMDMFDADTASANDVLSVGTVPANTDGDAQPDYLDLDSEADGIPDTVEAFPTAGYVANDGNVSDQDADLDGVVDLFDSNDASTGDFGGTFTQPEDTDVDSTPDYLDTDSDADTLNDSAEIAAAISPTYADPDGSVSTTLASLQNTDSDTSDVDFRSLNDADGDGVPDATDPNASNPCIPNVGGAPTTKDCDGDGNPVATDPNDNAPSATNDSGTAGATINLLANDDYLSNNDPNNLGTTSITTFAAGTTCAGTPTYNATTGTVVYASAASETSGTCDLVYEVCNTATTAGALPVCTTATVTITLADTDGDGIPDDVDSAPADACVPNATGTPGTKDCDGDGNPASSDPDPSAPNAANDTGTPGSLVNLLANDDYLPNNDPANLGTTSIIGVASGTTCAGIPTFNATTGNMMYTAAAGEVSGTCVIEYEVCNIPSGAGTNACSTATVTMTLADADGDGIPDSLDSDPADACVPNTSGTPGSKDCDGDGNPASSDPDPAAPNATNDTGAPGTPVNLLANDDYLPNNDPANLGTTSITGVASGTTCTGTPVFDATTGNMTYTAAASEVSGSCVIEYEVCNTPASSAPVCSTAIVTMTLADADGDGIPDSLDSDPADACVPNTSGTPGTKDCDGDGNPASSDPDPSAPNATNDTGAPGTPVNLLANDDYLPNNDPANLGTTSITAVASGTTCTGTPTFDATTGNMTYAAAASEVSGSCVIEYEVCNAPASSTPVCSTAIVTMTLADADGDGIPDSLDSDPADACVPNATGTPGSKDCDKDGNPASSDPDPSAPNATNDTGAPGTPINLLANDDFLSNNDPANLGTTTITGVASGTTCTGTSNFNAADGTMTYTPAAGEVSGACIVEYEVCNTALVGTTPVCETALVSITLADSDGDGIPDSLDSDPAEACVPNMAGTPGTKDCDGDGNPASTDPDPAAPDASDDAGAAGNPINILANDDYLPNNDPDVIGTTSITQVGGSCTGSVSLNATTGIAIYTAGPGDTGPTCTVDYEVCSTNSASTTTCENATITLTIPVPTNVPDTDGDGLADDVDSAPNDACVPNMAGTPGTKDCDGDGNPASSDPDPAAPDASHDAGAAGNPINILANDDYLPNNDPAVIGTTSITQVGGSCTGSVSLNATTGIAIYTAGSGDTGPTCTVDYEVCSTSSASTAICENATITFTIPAPTNVPDTDGDGIADDMDSAPNDACVPNMAGIPGNKDCDGDGHPAASDPDAAAPNATNDTGNAGVPVDILANDDYLPNNNPGNTGTTTLTHIGGTCAGNVALDATTGTVTYTTGVGEAGTSCSINYRVCSDSSGAPVCRTAEVTITNGGSNPPSNPNPTPTPGADSDGDGIPDSVEGTGDTDGDGVPDYLDLDSDNDGLLDATEMTEDTDNDGIPDYLDRDSDNDGLTDTYEAGGPDANGDGIVDDFIDNNNDGWSDNVAASPLPEPDFDGDGIVDYLDLDSDNDGLTDIMESLGAEWDANNDGMVDNPVDTNGDGLADNIIVNDVSDSDNDGARDHLDLNGQQAADGDIRIGLQGGGCTIATSNAAADPLLAVLMLLSMLWLSVRRYLPHQRKQHKRSLRKGMQRKGLAQKLTWFVVASTCVLSSCSMGRMDRTNPYATGTNANNPGTQFSKHVYAGAGLGASWLEPDTSEVPGVDVNDRVNGGGQATLGVDLTKHFSLEMHTADLGSAGLSPTGRINYHMHGASALLYAGKNRHNHARRGLTGYGRIGYGTLDDSAVGDVNYIENNNTHVLFGGGLEYATRSGLGLRAELISFDADARYGQFGLIYRMGGRHKRPPARIAKAPTPPPQPAPAPVVVEQPVVVPSVPAVQVPAPDPCAHFTGVLEGVNFHTDSDRLTSEAQTILDGIANELALCPTTPVAISAHTDNQGSDEYNRGLSKRRALSVARHLSQRGVATSRMSARAFGESRPIAPNTTAQGRASNRRVELVAQ